MRNCVNAIFLALILSACTPLPINQFSCMYADASEFSDLFDEMLCGE